MTCFVADNNTVILLLLPDTEEVSESSLSQEFGRLMSVRYRGDRQDRVKHSEITDSIHSHCHRILCQNLQSVINYGWNTAMRKYATMCTCNEICH